MSFSPLRSHYIFVLYDYVCSIHFLSFVDRFRESIRLKWIRLYAFRSKQVFEGHLSRYFYTTRSRIHVKYYTYTTRLHLRVVHIYVFIYMYLCVIIIFWNAGCPYYYVRVVRRVFQNLLAMPRPGQIPLQCCVLFLVFLPPPIAAAVCPLNTHRTTGHTFLKLFHYHKPGSGYYVIYYILYIHVIYMCVCVYIQ